MIKLTKVIVPLLTGFEEIEAITVIDVLRRAEIEVLIVGVNRIKEVKGAHDIIIKVDQDINEINVQEITGIILSGGLPGYINLKNNSKVISLIQKLNKQSKLIAAICAAPIVLEKAGVLNKRQVTCYPNFAQELPSAEYIDKDVVVSDNIVTACGVGGSLEFALTLVAYIKDKKTAETLRKAMLVNLKN